jgi:hypothetical protein
MREAPNSVLDDVELAALHRIYDDICTELNIGSDQPRRDEVAATVMDIAQTGERDYGAIHQRAVIKLTNLVTS